MYSFTFYRSVDFSVAIQRVSEICDAFPAPMTALLHTQLQQIRLSIRDMTAHTKYLTKLLEDHNHETINNNQNIENGEAENEIGSQVS